MPYPGPTVYPSGLLYPGLTGPWSPIAIGDLVFNTEEDADGVQWVISDLAGWGSPGSTLQLTQRTRGLGATASEPFGKSRTMVATGNILAPTPELLTSSIDKLIASVTLDPFQLIVNEPGLIRSVTAQRQDDVLPKKLNAYEAEFTAQFVAKEPRKFGDLITATTLLPSSTGGRTYPAMYPITYTGSSNTGVLRLTNPGNEQAPAWLRIDGPIPAGGWTVTHVGKKRSLAFASSLALAAGEFVTVDMDRKEVLAQGQSARQGYVTSRGWFSLDPGDNDIAFSAANYSPTAQLTVSTKPAWQ